jgi:hypothetical protein
MTPATTSHALRIHTGTPLQRRMRWRRWLERAADAAVVIVLFGTLAVALAPIAVSVLRSDVRAAVQAEEAWAADRSAGAATATLLGRPVADDDGSPAVDRAGQAFAGLR